MSAMLREDPDTWRLILLTPGNMPTVVRDRIEADRERFRLQVEGWISIDNCEIRNDGVSLKLPLEAAPAYEPKERDMRLQRTRPAGTLPGRLPGINPCGTA